VQSEVGRKPIHQSRCALAGSLWVSCSGWPLDLDNHSQPSAIDKLDFELVECYTRCHILAASMHKHGGMFMSIHTLRTLF